MLEYEKRHKSPAMQSAPPPVGRGTSGGSMTNRHGSTHSAGGAGIPGIPVPRSTGGGGLPVPGVPTARAPIKRSSTGDRSSGGSSPPGGAYKANLKRNVSLPNESSSPPRMVSPQPAGGPRHDPRVQQFEESSSSEEEEEDVQQSSYPAKQAPLPEPEPEPIPVVDPGQPMTVKVLSIAAEETFSVTFNVLPETKVEKLKLAVQKEKGIPIMQQALCLGGATLLVDEQLLTDYNISGQTLDLFHAPGFPIRNLIIDQFGEKHRLAVDEPCGSFASVIDKIRTSFWFSDQLRYMSPEEVSKVGLKLCFEGQEFTKYSTKTLGEIEIFDESTLFLETYEDNTPAPAPAAEEDSTALALRLQMEAFEASEAEAQQQQKPKQKAKKKNRHSDDYEAPIEYESEVVRKARGKAWQQVAGAKMEQEDAHTRAEEARNRLQGGGGAAPAPAPAPKEKKKKKKKNRDSDDYEAPIVYESEEVRQARAKAWQHVAGTKIEQEEAHARAEEARARLNQSNNRGNGEGGGGGSGGFNLL